MVPMKFSHIIIRIKTIAQFQTQKCTLHCWIIIVESETMLPWDTSTWDINYFVYSFSGNRVIGFGVIRPLQAASSHRIGPLLAENAAATQVILLSLLSKIAKETLFIDSPLCNPSFTRILETDLKMEQVDERARMYSRGNPGIEVQKMFGVLSKDIGWLEGSVYE